MVSDWIQKLEQYRAADFASAGKCVSALYLRYMV